MVVVLLVLIGLALFCIIFLTYLADIIRNGLAPNIPSPHSALGEITQALQITKGDKVMEIGCGDARMIKQAAINYPNARFIGIDNGLLALSQAKLNTMRVKNVRIQYGNFKKSPKLKANKFYVYLLPEALEIISPKIPKGSKVVSLEYKFAGLKPSKTIVLKQPTNLVHKLYVYDF